MRKWSHIFIVQLMDYIDANLATKQKNIALIWDIMLNPSITLLDILVKFVGKLFKHMAVLKDMKRFVNWNLLENKFVIHTYLKIIKYRFRTFLKLNFLLQGQHNVFEDTQDKISSVSNMIRTIFKNKIFQGFFSKHGQDKSLCPYMFRRPWIFQMR